MKFVCSLFRTPLDHFAEVALAAEAAGFDAVALSDRVAHIERIESKFPYTPNGDRPWQSSDDFPDVWVATAMIAAATHRIRCLQAVFILPARDPFSTAKSLATLARMSNDRISLGFGVGWMREEFDLTGQTFERRGARAEEMIALMRKLWTGESIDHHGEFYEAKGVKTGLALRHPIPILCSGESDVAIRRAVRIGDGWIPPISLHSADLLEPKLREIRRLRSASRRGQDRDREAQDDSFGVYWTPGDGFDCGDRASVEELEHLGVTHLFASPWRFDEAAALDARERVARLEDFGREVIALHA